MDLIFTEATHEYRHGEGGEVLPSVTGILKSEGYIDGDWYTEAARIRGTYVHKICHLHNIGDLDETTVDETLVGYYEAYLSFLAETQFVVEDSELLVHSDTYLFAGTLDIRGKFPGAKMKSVIDIKSGSIEPWVAIQLAGYTVCLPDPHERYSLQLTADGKYHLKQWKDRSDQGVFLGALAGFHWKNNNLKRR